MTPPYKRIAETWDAKRSFSEICYFFDTLNSVLLTESNTLFSRYN